MRGVRRAAAGGGLLALLLACPGPPAARGDDTAPPAWEYKAVTFGGGDGRSSEALNALAAGGWEYVGPRAGGQVAFRRPAKAAAAAPEAVHLVAGAGAGPPAADLARHPGVRVARTFADLQRAASRRTAVWIDGGATGLLGAEGREWVARKSLEGYPFVLVGSSDALYAFRERLNCFLISGPGKVEWDLEEVTGGFSVIMLDVRRSGEGVSIGGPRRGYKQAATVGAMLGVTNRLLAGEPLPEKP